MDIYLEIQDKLGTKKFQKIPSFKASGCISSGECFQIDDNKVFVKLNKQRDALPMFWGELSSLKAIRQTCTISAPEPLCIVADPNSDGGAIVMQYLNLTSVTNWEKLGSDLADFHLFNTFMGKKKEKLSSWIGKPPKGDTPRDIDTVFRKETQFKIPDHLLDEMDYIEQFGFDTSTFCGIIAQNNEWNDDWIEFYARNRLEYQIKLVLEKDGDREVNEFWSHLQLKVHRFFDDINVPIKPSLLHGDLWSGNVSQVDQTPVVYDPASFYGHSEFDLAIAKLFGGFDQKFYDEYFKKIPKNKGFEKRSNLYTLFHTLNHWNHFGSHKRQTKQIMKNLVNLC